MQTQADQSIHLPSPAPPTPVKVLHVLGRFNPGGVETWLLRVLQTIDREQFQLDFWVHDPADGFYDAEIKALGSRIFVSPSISSPRTYAAALRQTLREFGPFQVVHSHVHHFSGWVLQIARQANVPVRIAHSHLDTQRVDQQASLQRRCYLWLMQTWIRQSATAGMAASDLAAASLFGPNWQRDPRWQVLHCGIDPKPFQQSVNVATLRARFQIPDDAFVIGHVGRFEEQKNHRFLLEITAAVLEQQPHTYLLLIGDGSLRPEIQSYAMQLGIANRVIFAGIHRDIPQLMQGVMDVFVLPSLQEGLPLVLMEAQAAGLPSVIADTITQEVDLLTDFITRCSLSQPLMDWVQAILAVKTIASPGLPKQLAPENQARFEQSSFNIHNGVQVLECFYAGGLSHGL